MVCVIPDARRKRFRHRHGRTWHTDAKDLRQSTELRARQGNRVNVVLGPFQATHYRTVMAHLSLRGV